MNIYCSADRYIFQLMSAIYHNVIRFTYSNNRKQSGVSKSISQIKDSMFFNCCLDIVIKAREGWTKNISQLALLGFRTKVIFHRSQVTGHLVIHEESTVQTMSKEHVTDIFRSAQPQADSSWGKDENLGQTRGKFMCLSVLIWYLFYLLKACKKLSGFFRRVQGWLNNKKTWLSKRSSIHNWFCLLFAHTFIRLIC